MSDSVKRGAVDQLEPAQRSQQPAENRTLALIAGVVALLSLIAFFNSYQWDFLKAITESGDPGRVYVALSITGVAWAAVILRQLIKGK